MSDADDKVCLRRFGLNFDPPSLVLEYERPASGRLFHRRIGLRRLGPTSDPSRTAEKIRRQNKALLAEDQVPFEQLVSVVARLQARQVAEGLKAGEKTDEKAPSVPASPASQPSLGASPVAADAPAETETVRTTEEAPEAPSVPASPASQPSPGASPAAADAPAETVRTTEEAAEAAPTEAAATVPSDAEDTQAAAAAVAKAAAEAEEVDFADAPDLPALDGDLDLNKLSTVDLNKYKAQMDVAYSANQCKKGDEGFEYDVRIDHEIDADADSCGWDDSEEED